MQPPDSGSPTDCTLDSSPVDWIIEYPETGALLNQLGIDCSCAGKSLEYACRQQGHDPQVVLAQLIQCVRGD